MGDIGQSDAVWLRFLRELFFFVRVARRAEDDRRRYTHERTQFFNINDKNANFTVPHDDNELTGVDLGVNTGPNGELYVRLVANVGNWDVHLYTAAGATAGDEVAQAIDVADGATATLVAVNSSGLTGALRLDASVVAEADDVHQLLVITDWKLETLNIWPGDGESAKDTSSRNAVGRMLARCGAGMAQVQAAIRSGLEEWALQFAEENSIPVVGRGNAFLQVAETVLIGETETRDDESGEVTQLRRGFFQALTAAMAAETVGSTQDLVERVVAASAGTFSASNTGSGTVASHTPEGHTPIGRWRWRCVFGRGNGGGGQERFDGEFTAADGDRTFTFRGLQVKAGYKGPNGFGEITLLRSLTKTGDDTHTMVGAASTFSTSGESEANTNDGLLYGLISANGSNWDIEFYSTAARLPNDLVAAAINKATAAGSVTAEPRKGSELTITFDVGSAPVDEDEFTIDLNYFSINNGAGGGEASTPDEFYVDTTLTSTGVASNVLAVLWDAYVNTDTSGSELITDAFAAKINTFHPYAKLDI